MTIYAAILLLSSTGSASRETTVPVSIERVLWGVICGGVRDVALRFVPTDIPVLGRANGLDVRALSLRIDGTVRSGVFAWTGAAYRVAGYATDRRTDGSVEYWYRLRIRGFVVERRTRIADGCVVLTTDVYGSIGPRGELHYVEMVLRATEISAGTTAITGSLVGRSHIGDRCRIVRRIAEQRISKALAAVLAETEVRGRRLYSAGDPNAISDALIEGICR